MYVDEGTQVPAQPKKVTLWSRDLAEACRRHGGADTPFFERLPRFPDGAALIASADLADFFAIIGVGYPGAPARPMNRDLTYRLDELRMLQPRGYAYRALAPFEHVWYTVAYPAYYQKRLGGELAMTVAPWLSAPLRQEEGDLAALPVQVDFKRRLDEPNETGFASALVAWSRSVAVQGVFGEGRAQLATPEVMFQGTRAMFRVDLSQSGQATLNWLVLSLLDFAMKATPIEAISFAHLGIDVPLKKNGAPHTLPLLG